MSATALQREKDSTQSLPPAVESDAQAIRILRAQVESLTSKLESSNIEIKNLQASVISREQELRRNVRTINTLENQVGKSSAPPIPSSVDEHMAAKMAGSYSQRPTSGMNPLESVEAVDLANRRLIDQLNAQVDFLNEQLAQRDFQLKDMIALARAAEHYKNDVGIK